MARVPDIQFEQLTPEQQRLYKEISGPRGAVGGPFAIWLRLPDIADKANQLGNAVRVHGRLDKRLFELMVLMIARHWSSQYEWFVHEEAGLKAGLTSDVIEAIRHGRMPNFVRDDERLIYDIIGELCETRTLSQPSYDRALAALGLELLIELITAAGFYTLAAMVINAFDAPVPGGRRPLS